MIIGVFILCRREEVMAMKINETGRINPINPYHRHGDGQLAASGRKEKKKDEVTISPEAKELQELQAADAELNLKKVEDLKQAVQTGTYHVDAGNIAEKLLPYLK
jgi:negative regulator of flagellin synthesis FlgM